jgi:hypothetical protein
VTFVTCGTEHLGTPPSGHLYTAPDMADVLERLKVLINSSTPIVVMETVEEVRAVSLVRTACAAVNLPTFEWTIAKGLVRSGSSPSVVGPDPAAAIGSGQTAPHTSNGGAEAERLANAVLSSLQKPSGSSAAGLYNSREPVQALETLESITIDAVFILKDFHRHMDDAVVVRRLRDVGQKFSTSRRTVVLTAPNIKMPPELESLVEYVDLPLPDQSRLREIIDQTFARLARTYSLKRKLDAAGLDAMAANLRGLTEEEAEPW